MGGSATSAALSVLSAVADSATSSSSRSEKRNLLLLLLLYSFAYYCQLKKATAPDVGFNLWFVPLLRAPNLF